MANGHRLQTSETGGGARLLRLALAQINTHVGALNANLARITAAADEAYAAGAQVVCFPELAIPGYPPEDLLLKPGFVEDNLAALAALTEASSRWNGMTLIVGFADRDSDLYNAAAIVRDGKRRGTYHKQFLPNYGVFDEDRYFRPGDAAPNFVIDGVVVGVSICEDIWYPGGPPTLQAYSGAEALLNISASPFFVGKQADRERMLATRAADTGAIVAYLNLVGGQDELIFDGSSVVFDGSGNMLARARAFEEDMLLVDLKVDEVFRTRLHDPRRRKFLPALPAADRAAIVVSERPSARLTTSDRAERPARIEPPVTGAAEAYAALTLGVRDYVRKNGFTSAVIALSGGIDSALTAVIAVDALGADAVTGVSMPSRYSSAGSKDDARSLAEHLGMRYLTLPIEETFVAMLNTLREPFAEDTRAAVAVAEENLQARIRGNLLMALSNASGAIVLTTGNKSELAVGYATLYGDMAGGYAVLKDVFKTLVFDLSRWRNAQAGYDLIPQHTLDKPPSAELCEDQKDTDSLPPYEVLDPILRAYVEDDRGVAEIARMGYDAETVRRIIAMVDRSEYKRRQAPPGVKITERAFGRDRRLPITNGYKDASAAPRSPAKTARRTPAGARAR